MDYSKINIFNLLQTKMRYLGQRQSMLSENIANADTPGYRPKDLEKLDFKKHLSQQSGGGMMTTSPMHMKGSGGGNGEFKTAAQYKTYETTPSDNSSVVEEQMMKVSQTASDYQLATSLYAKTSGLFKLILGNKQ